MYPNSENRNQSVLFVCTLMDHMQISDVFLSRTLKWQIDDCTYMCGATLWKNAEVHDSYMG